MMEKGNGRNWSDLTDITSKLLKEKRRKTYLSTCSHFFVQLCVRAKSLQSCLDLGNPMDCSLPGSSARGIPQARTLEWGAMPSSRGSSPPRDRTRASCLLHWQVASLPPGKPECWLQTIRIRQDAASRMPKFWLSIANWNAHLGLVLNTNEWSGLRSNLGDPPERQPIVSTCTQYFQDKPKVHDLNDFYSFYMKQLCGPGKINLQIGFRLQATRLRSLV